MVAALFDTNIVIDYLNGVAPARREMELYDQRSISIITWMEVLVGASSKVEPATRAYLKSFAVIPVSETIAERAVSLRKIHRLRLPDAIILASAEINALLLVTRDTKDFFEQMPGVRIPYRL